MGNDFQNGVNIRATRSIYSVFVKRFLDVFLSSCALLVLSPLFIITFVLELIFHGSPTIFNTIRPGKDEKLFHLYKFRSMTNKRDKDGYLLPDSERLTTFGKILRRTSIDELPELINIIKGDMSIIGPRPLLVEYLPLYSEKHRMRHIIRPGLACDRITPTTSKTWTWREQLDNDIFYVENMSFLVDIKMVFAVLMVALKGGESRVNGCRVPFSEENLDETKPRGEVSKYKN